MGQKVNPPVSGQVIKNWVPVGLPARQLLAILVEDYKIRDYIMNKRMLTRANGEKIGQAAFKAAGIAQVEIERSSDNKIKIHILAAKAPVCLSVLGRRDQSSDAEISKIADSKDVSKYR